MRRVIDAAAGDADLSQTLLQVAQEIHRQDLEANIGMGRLGSALIEAGSSILTWCSPSKEFDRSLPYVSGPQNL